MSIKSRVAIGIMGGAVALLALNACTPKDADKTASVTAPAAAPAEKEVIAATVNGTKITEKQVDMIMKQQGAQGMPNNPETRKMVIDDLAIRILVADEASKKGLDKAQDTVDQLAMAKQSILATAFVQDYTKTNTVTDDALKAEYDKLKAQSSGNQYKARHILVEKEDEAKAIIAKLNKNPKEFDALAKAQSKDPGSKDKGGDLGWFDPHSMVPEFGAALAKMAKGKFTEEPVKTQFGYHVIMLDDTRPNPTTFPPMEQIKAGLSQQIQQQNLKKLLDDMKAKAKIDIVASAAPAPAPAAIPAAPEAASAPAAAAPAEPVKK